MITTVAALAVPSAALAGPPSLKLALPPTERVGQPIAVTAKGVTDGVLRLFLFADEQRRPCAATPSVEQHGSWELTPFGGEPLTVGEFSRTYSYTPQIQIAELCAYLDDSATAAPAATAITPDPVREYQESLDEAPAGEEITAELPGALKPQPVNQQLMNEYWARVERERQEHERVRTSVRPCIVPRLHGRSLSAARRALQAAGCALGHVRRKPAHGRPLVVVSQSASAGKALEGGASVGVVLGPRRR